LAFEIPAGQGEDWRTVALWRGVLGEGAALPDPLVELGITSARVDLVVGRGEVLADRAELGARRSEL
jgi:hypothetical protein